MLILKNFFNLKRQHHHARSIKSIWKPKSNQNSKAKVVLFHHTKLEHRGEAIYQFGLLIHYNMTFKLLLSGELGFDCGPWLSSFHQLKGEVYICFACRLLSQSQSNITAYLRSFIFKPKYTLYKKALFINYELLNVVSFGVGIMIASEWKQQLLCWNLVVFVFLMCITVISNNKLTGTTF